MDERIANETVDGGVSLAADTWPLSAREAAAVLGVSERTIRRAIVRGELPATLHAGVYRIARGDVERFQTQRRKPTPRQLESPGPSPWLIPFPAHDDIGQ